MFLTNCPRCGDHCYELLKTHSHCTECNYSPEHDIAYLDWRRLEFDNTHYVRSRLADEAQLWMNTPSDYSYGGSIRSAL